MLLRSFHRRRLGYHGFLRERAHTAATRAVPPRPPTLRKSSRIHEFRRPHWRNRGDRRSGSHHVPEQESRVIRSIIVTLAVATILGIAGAAYGDNYGTTRTESARMTALVYRTFGTGAVGRCMVRIMWRESGGNPRAANYHDANGGSYGLLQLNGAHRWQGETLAQFQRRQWNPVTHLAAARRLYNGAGFGPWRGCPS